MPTYARSGSREMMNAILTMILLLLILSSLPAAGQNKSDKADKKRHKASESDFKCGTGSKTCEINIASQNLSKDEKTTGPKNIIVTGANTLRYDYVFTSTVTFAPGPSIDLFTLGTSSTPKPAPTPTKSGGSNAAATADREMDFFKQQAANLTDNASAWVDAANQTSLLVNAASDDMRNLLENSDSLLRADRTGPDELKREITERQIDLGKCPAAGQSAESLNNAVAGLSSIFQRGVCAYWPQTSKIDSLVSQIKKLQAQVQEKRAAAKAQMAKAEEKAAFSNAASTLSETDAAIEQFTAIMTTLNDLTLGGKKYNDFVQLQANLRKWNQRMIGLSRLDKPFTLPPHKAPCTFAFLQTKTEKEEIQVTDLLPPASGDIKAGGPGSDNTAASSGSAKPSSSAPATTTIPLVTVECTSPFSLSAGFAFSSITERDFLIQPVPNAPNSTTTTNRFTTDAHSNFHPLPVAMVNMRYHEFSRLLSFQGSFGVAANIKGQSAGGSDAEYLFAPLTLGFFRTAFISPALHIGRDVRLGSNFHEGDVVPSNITTPPLQKSYRMGFAVAVTFTKP